MWQNYAKTVLRGIWRYKGYSAINIFGLATGIACFLLIMLYVQYELGFDRFHSKADRVYRVSLHAVLAGNAIDVATSPYPMAATLLREFPEVEASARLRKFFRDTLISEGDTHYLERQIFHADQSLLEVLDFDFIAGNPQLALVEPYSLVITESIARKYFGDTAVVGRSLRMNSDRDYQVTGVIADMPGNSHFHADILVSFTSDSEHDSPIWISNNIATYLLVRPGTDVAALEDKLDILVSKYVAPQIQQAIGTTFEELEAAGGTYYYALQALTDIHLHSQLEGELEPNGNADYVYTFLAVAVFILLLACVNYMNLATARAANRAREIGLRKVLGAQRRQLSAQFLCESVMVTLCAVLLAIPAVALLLPAFSALTERTLSLSLLLNGQTLALIVLFAALVGVLAGSYPALYLAQVSPQSTLKGKLAHGAKSSWLRGILVVFQFAISIALVAATLIVFAQLDFIRNKPLGFDKEQVLVIRNANALGEARDAFVQRIKTLPGVVQAATSIHVPGEQISQSVFFRDGAPASEAKALWQFQVGYDYIETLGFELLEGRGFAREFGEDESAYIINERAATELGITDPLNERIVVALDDELRIGPIIGLVRDFHFESLHQEIRPLLFEYREFARYVVVRTEAGNVPQTIAGIAEDWRRTAPTAPFEYSFLATNLESLHEGDRRLGVVFSLFAVLAIVIACLGLYGLASYTTLQRTKEIGIRKTLGASLTAIVLLLARDFMRLVAVALVVAIPLAWVGMNWWLQLFSYRIDMPVLAFVYASVIASLVAFITVSVQSLATGRQNPTLSLRDE